MNLIICNKFLTSFYILSFVVVQFLSSIILCSVFYCECKFLKIYFYWQWQKLFKTVVKSFSEGIFFNFTAIKYNPSLKERGERREERRMRERNRFVQTTVASPCSHSNNQTTTHLAQYHTLQTPAPPYSVILNNEQWDITPQGESV